MLISRILDMPNSTAWNIIRKFQTTKEVADLPRTVHLGQPVQGKAATSFVVWNFLIMFWTVKLGMSRILEMSMTLYPWECIFKIVFCKFIETISKQKLYRTKI